MDTFAPITQLDASDRRHLFWLAMVHHVEAVVLGVIGLACSALGGLLVWVLMNQQAYVLEVEQVAAAKILLALFLFLAMGCLIPAVLLVIAGVQIQRCEAGAFCRIIALSQAVLLFPFGTAVTVYYYNVMRRPNVKAVIQAQSE